MDPLVSEEDLKKAAEILRRGLIPVPPNAEVLPPVGSIAAARGIVELAKLDEIRKGSEQLRAIRESRKLAAEKKLEELGLEA